MRVVFRIKVNGDMNIIEENIDNILELCKTFKVKKLFVLGSVLTDHFHDESDVDFVVEFKKIKDYEYAGNYFDLKFALENLLERKIDLLEEQAISNPFLRKSIDTGKQLLYGQ